MWQYFVLFWDKTRQNQPWYPPDTVYIPFAISDRYRYMYRLVIKMSILITWPNNACLAAFYSHSLTL